MSRSSLRTRRAVRIASLMLSWESSSKKSTTSQHRHWPEKPF